jgi:hypothetical protein
LAIADDDNSYRKDELYTLQEVDEMSEGSAPDAFRKPELALLFVDVFAVTRRFQEEQFF